MEVRNFTTETREGGVEMLELANRLAVPSRLWFLDDYLQALQSLQTPVGLMASAGSLFSALFGRDSLQIGLDVVDWYPEIAKTAALSLARYQGLEDNLLPEEVPGRIPHEVRVLDFGLGPVPSDQIAILNNLHSRWGTPNWLNEPSCVYYGSVDASFLFITLCARLGPQFLNQEFTHKCGCRLTIRQSFQMALEWCLQQINPRTGLVEFLRQNTQGLPFPVMRDGQMAHIHLNGQQANFRQPIATLDLQGIAYTALRSAARLLGKEAPANLLQTAERLQKQTLKQFWMPTENAFAMALDHDEDGAQRQVQTLTSVSAELLESGILTYNLSRKEQEKYADAVIRLMYSADFLTSVGIRMRALRHGSLVPYWDYQGAMVSWPLTTGRFSKGLRYLGMHGLAEDMENRMLNAIQLSGVPYEFYQVDGLGRVNYDPLEIASVPRETVLATNLPEHCQGWTVSAAIHALKRRSDKRLCSKRWYELENELLTQTGTRLIQTDAELQAAFPLNYGFHIDKPGGIEAEKEFCFQAGCA